MTWDKIVTPDDVVEFGGAKAYSFVQWISQAMPSIKAGAFFFSNTQRVLPSEMPFKKAAEEITIPNGSTLTGYVFPGLHVAILGQRLDWYHENRATGNRKTYCASFDEAAAIEGRSFVKGRVQIFTLVKQFAPWYGPVLVTSHGVVSRNFGNLVSEWAAKVINPLSAVAGKKLPHWLFWCPITTTGTMVQANPQHPSKVAYAKLDLPERVDQAWADKNYVGDDVAAHIRGMLPEVREWMAAKISNTDEAKPAERTTADDGPDWGGKAVNSGPAGFRNDNSDLPW